MEEIYRALGRIEGKLDQSLPRLNKIEHRVGKVENKQSWLLGGLAFLGFVITVYLAK